MKLINIGFGNMVNAERVVAVVSPESAPIKRIIREAEDKGNLINATYGRRTRAVIVTDSDHIVLSALQTETVSGRLSGDSAYIRFTAVKSVFYRYPYFLSGQDGSKRNPLHEKTEGESP